MTLQLIQSVFPNLTITTESGTIRQFEDILKEVGYLNSVGDRLELLAGQHPSVEEALMSISGNVRNTATVLEVLAVIKAEDDEPAEENSKARTRTVYELIPAPPMLCEVTDRYSIEYSLVADISRSLTQTAESLPTLVFVSPV